MGGLCGMGGNWVDGLCEMRGNWVGGLCGWTTRSNRVGG
jgi:hypothetical protein